MNEETAKKIEETIRPLEGWCTKEKACKLYDYITEKYFQLNGYHPSMVVELGVFGGKSLIPMAMALKHNWETHNVRGIIDGIDMWDTAVANEGIIGEVNKKYWAEMDFKNVIQRMNDVIEKEQLTPYINLFKGKSYEFGHLFTGKVIDILHQDSSHSTETSQKELDIYLPKMKEGSIWISDDIDWMDDAQNHTLWPAYERLTNSGFLELEDCPASELQSHYKILRKV